MTLFSKGDRVVFHGESKRGWKGMHGTVRHVDNGIGFALVVPDSGLPKSFDVRWSTIDMHHERDVNGRLVKRGKVKEIKPVKTPAIRCRNCGARIHQIGKRWQHVTEDADCFEGAEP